MLSNYQAVLFDFDGTLVPTLDLAGMKRQVVEFTTRQTGIARAEIEHLLAVELIDHTSAWLRARDGRAGPYFQAAHDLIKRIELDAARTTDLYPGVLDLFAAIKTRGMSIGIVTRNCTEAVKLMFPDVDDHCDSLLTRDDVAHLKPDTRHLEQCLREIGCDGASAVMVGDGALDMSVGKALGMLCIGVLGGHSSRAALEDAGADLVVARVSELAGEARKTSKHGVFNG
jgi:phosphoglycolate phosphatase